MDTTHLASAPPSTAAEGDRALAQLWSTLEPKLRVLKALVREADREARGNGGVSPALSAHIRDAITRFEPVFNDLAGDASPLGEDARAALGARVQAEILPYVLLSGNAERWYAKPRGYAGDYLSIAQVYADEARGVGRVGPLLDRGFLDMAAARAVRARRGLMAREIDAAMARRGGEGARVTTLACGPAQEVFDVFATLAQPAALAVTLVDMDDEALAFVAKKRDALGLGEQMSLVNANLIRLVARKHPFELAPQDLIYSIGLIDYFEDPFIIRLLDFAHAHLRPGGRVILGNFHPRNASKALMDHVLEWRLVHRTEDDMNRLFAASRFGRPCSRILYEENRINLFAEGVREEA